ncbi:MAG: hypothetical protein K2X03_22405 [Bryobacteraceae bacterium]|nr:hypothetical protein [Bryobacteraceae bacterium]
MLACSLLLALLFQDPKPKIDDPTTVRLPDGKLQSEEILKAEHKRSLKDAQELVRLSQEVQQELEQQEHHVLSIGMLKKLDEVEKLARKLRGRVKR